MAESLNDNHGTCDRFMDLYCDVCYVVKNLHVRPEAYCNHCHQYICRDCLSVHKTLLGTSDQVIRTGQDMPKSQADKPPRFEYCNIHQRHCKDQYCSEHKVLLCTLCVQLNHEDCPVESVECAAKNISSSEISLLYNSVVDFKTQLLSAESRIENDISDLMEQKISILENIQKIYDKTMSKFKTLFQDIKSDLESKFQYQSSALTIDQYHIKHATVNLKSTLDDIEVLKGRTIDTKVFLKIQDILKNIDKCKMYVSTFKQTVTRRMLNFVSDETMENVLSSSFTLGTVSLEESNHDVSISVPEIMFPVSPIKLSQAIAPGYQPSGGTKPVSEIRAQQHTSYNIKLQNEKTCFITGLSITLDGRRLLADRDNSKIKMFSRDMQIIHSLSLPFWPWDIAVTGDREAVVSVPDQPKLFILDVSDEQMSIGRTLELSFRVRGIVTYKDKLIVSSLDPPRSVKLIDHSGKVFWSTSTDQQGQQLFYWPYYVTCYNDRSSSAVIVTDEGNNTLTLLDSNTGDVTNRQHVGGLPTGVTTDTAGNIYVFYCKKRALAVLSTDLSEERILLTRRDGINGNPQAIAYNTEDNQLLVSYDSCNVVDCFQLL